jgi:predicted nucleotide-binding protein (sugar kinase/HSP70/actin superfamily)
MEEKGRIGIPKALMFYRYFPLWKCFFEELGWKVMVSSGPGKKGKLVYFEDSCLPMKLLITHAVDLKDRADHLFVPRLVSLHRSHIMCPKFRGAPDIVRLATEGTVSILDETVDLRTREHSMLQCFLKTGRRLGADEKKTKKAFQNAVRFFTNFQKGWEDRINRFPLKDLFKFDLLIPSEKSISPPPAGRRSRVRGGDEGEGGRTQYRVAFVGHPYNLFDTDVNKDILTFAKSLGMTIITPESLSEKEIDGQVSDLSKEIYWSSGREIVGSLFHFLSGEADGVVFLTSFKCGIDALLQEFVRRRLKVRGGSSIPFLILSLDEHSGREGLTTRLEALRDVMEQREENVKCQNTKFK